jgi:secernin
MANDMVVALNEASANGNTLFGLNYLGTADDRSSVKVVRGKTHDAGEMARCSLLTFPQARQTFTVLGIQPAGQWGFTHGINENHVAVGVTDWQSRFTGCQAALSGTDLVRLALERSHSAHHAVDILADLLEHHGQDQAAGCDNIFLLADGKEAFVLETAGRYWALQECGHTRVVTDAGMIRQDWHRLAPGLAQFTIQQGWGLDDGSKIDFNGCLASSSRSNKNAQKRWGRASLALAQQQGAIDLHYLRRMLADHFLDNRDFLPAGATTLQSTFLVDLARSEQPLVAWVAFGSPDTAISFPVCLAGEIPLPLSDPNATPQSIQAQTRLLEGLARSQSRAKVHEMVEKLQAAFDQGAEEFLLKAQLARHQDRALSQLATEMMSRHVEMFDSECSSVLGLDNPVRSRPMRAEEEVFFFA